MIVFKQLTISIKTQHDNKINVSCSANQQNVTLHVKHDHQYRRNFKSLNIIWYIVCFFLYLLRRLIFFSRNTSSILHVEYKALWVRDCLCFTPYKYIMHRLSVTLRNYQPVAWVLYQRVIDQSKADICIKPGRSKFTPTHYPDSDPTSLCSFPLMLLSGEEKQIISYSLVWLTRPGLWPTICRIRSDHANLYSTDAVLWW